VHELIGRLVPYVALFFEVLGLAAIVGGLVVAVVAASRTVRAGGTNRAAYRATRRVFSRSVLLGLEFLVAADLIKTVAINPTLDSLYVLGLLVLIRTGLAWSLDVELEGVWPWQKRALEDRELMDGIKHPDAEL
jgi:uncharacterized membrane protein